MYVYNIFQTAFQSVYMLDNGHVMYENAARTKSSHQGRGYMGLMRSIMVYVLRRQYPQLHSVMWLGVGNKRQEMYIKENPLKAIMLAKTVNAYFHMRGRIFFYVSHFPG